MKTSNIFAFKIINNYTFLQKNKITWEQVIYLNVIN